MCTQRNPALDHSLWSPCFPKGHPIASSERFYKHRVVSKRFFPQTARREDLRAVALAYPFILIVVSGEAAQKQVCCLQSEESYIYQWDEQKA